MGLPWLPLLGLYRLTWIRQLTPPPYRSPLPDGFNLAVNNNNDLGVKKGPSHMLTTHPLELATPMSSMGGQPTSAGNLIPALGPN